MNKLRVTVDGTAYEVEVEFLDEAGETVAHAPTQTAAPRRARTAAAATPVTSAPSAKAPAAGGPGAVPSPLSAIVVAIHVAKGDSVKAGQKVATLEAMKMNTEVSAPNAGTVTGIEVAAGDSVEEGRTLLTIQ